ncbi:MAG: tetratricopeptide repeat protein [Terriglobales bacterium]
MTKKMLATLLFLVVLAAPAWPVNRQILALQQQVSLLMTEIQNLQHSFTANVATLKTLMGQNADNINKLQLALNTLQHAVDARGADNGQNWQQANQQFQAITQTLNDLQAQINKANEALQQIQQAQQNLPAPQSQPTTAPTGGTNPATPGNGAASGTAPPSGSGSAAAASPTLPAAQLYQNAISDYVAGSYPLAANEFEEFLKSYANDGHAPEAAYYLGDIQMKERHYQAAVKTFDSVLNNFPDQKVAAGAQLKKAYSLIALRERSAGIRELRNLIRHFPRSQEAHQAREELEALGVSAR